MIICSMDFHTLRHPSQSNRQQSSPHPRIDRYNNNNDDDRGAFQLLLTRHRIIKRKRSSSNPLSSLEEGDEGAQVVSCCVLCQIKKVMQHMHDIIPYMFDYWAFVHLLLLKSSKSNRLKRFAATRGQFTLAI